VTFIFVKRRVTHHLRHMGPCFHININVGPTFISTKWQFCNFFEQWQTIERAPIMK